jgi:hypothetical protein
VPATRTLTVVRLVERYDLASHLAYIEAMFTWHSRVPRRQTCAFSQASDDVGFPLSRTTGHWPGSRPSTPGARC